LPWMGRYLVEEEGDACHGSPAAAVAGEAAQVERSGELGHVVPRRRCGCHDQHPVAYGHA
jgi:hypothetical protein